MSYDKLEYGVRRRTPQDESDIVPPPTKEELEKAELERTLEEGKKDPRNLPLWAREDDEDLLTEEEKNNSRRKSYTTIIIVAITRKNLVGSIPLHKP